MLEAVVTARTTTAVTLRTLLLPPPLKPGPTVVEGDEAHHGRVVLRLRPGDDVRLADGDGHSALGVVTGVGREALEVEVGAVDPVDEGPAASLTVACPAPKGDRFADLVRSLSELGVGRYRPLVCERGERVPANLERCRRIAADALKQCRRARVMVVDDAMDVAALAASGETLRVCDRDGGPAEPGTPTPTTLVVGPEGGFTEVERGALAAVGRCVRLASTVLRVETAAVAASAVWIAAWEAATP